MSNTSLTRLANLCIITAVADHHLPSFPTPLVGRSTYLREIAHLLADPECRLLALVGPGGIGKTRLAVEAARCFDACDAVYFVALQPVAEPASVAGAIADAVGLRQGVTGDPQQELLEQVREQAWLLVLDNFEHLVEAAPLLSRLLAQAPRLRLLVTSRVRLDLLEEFVLEVSGLACPFSAHDMNPERSGAVELFVQRARHANAGFALTPAHHHAVFRIVHLVEGMPLGIELAANWVRALSCEEIAGEIERSLDILHSSGRNLPPRHRTMRAAFDSTWQQLRPEQRAVFMRLSVFRGGFTRDAAAAVAGATLPVLSALIDQSLLRVDEGGRYHVHELLRQYAQEWLEQDEDATNAARNSHSAWFTGWLAAQEEAVTGRSQRRALQEITLDIDNVRAAWAWAAKRLYTGYLRQAVSALSQYCDVRGLYHTGAELCEQAIERLRTAPRSDACDLALAALFSAVGWLYIRLGRFEESHQVFTSSLAILTELGAVLPPGYIGEPLLGLALLADVLGEYAEAIELADKSRRHAAARNDSQSLLVAHYILASVAFAQGDYATARRQAQTSRTLASATGNLWMIAYLAIILGNIAREVGKYREAQTCYEECYAIQHELGNPEGMASAQLNLAALACVEQDFAKAAALYEQSYTLCSEIHDPGGQMRALAGLGETAQAAGIMRAAGDYFCRALTLAVNLRSAPLLLPMLLPIGGLLAAAGEAELAARTWTLVMRHDASGRDMHRQAQEYLARLAAVRPAHVQTDGEEEQMDPFALAGELRALLAVGIAAAPTVGRAAGHAVDHSAGHTALVEPLSEREIEVLHLLAQGLTNQQIADALTVVLGTVKAHNHHIFGKLGVSNRVQALAQARALALI